MQPGGSRGTTRTTCGVSSEERYRELCQTHAGVGKPSRARLIAADASASIPTPVEEILAWLAGADQS